MKALRAASCALLMALMGCTPEVAPPVSAVRDPAVTLASTTRFDVARFAGSWSLRARIAGQPSLVGLDVEVDGAEIALTELHVSCDGAGNCEALGDRGLGAVSGPGRITLDYLGGTRKELIVLWVDPDYRTAALSDRAGSFAWVVDRKRTGGQDRQKAAREVLDFNGFDLGQLRRVSE